MRVAVVVWTKGQRKSFWTNFVKVFTIRFILVHYSCTKSYLKKLYKLTPVLAKFSTFPISCCVYFLNNWTVSSIWVSIAKQGFELHANTLPRAFTAVSLLPEGKNPLTIQNKPQIRTGLSECRLSKSYKLMQNIKAFFKTPDTVNSAISYRVILLRTDPWHFFFKSPSV